MKSNHPSSLSGGLTPIKIHVSWESGGESGSWTFFPSAPELISCLQNASSGHLVQTYTLHSMLLLFLPPYMKNGYSCIARCLQNRVNSSLNQLGKALNIGSKPCGEKVYPGCTSIHCIGEGRPIVLEGIRGSWLKSIFDDQLRLPAVETTIAWNLPKKTFSLVSQYSLKSV